MPRKRYSPEEIIANLREADVILSEGASVAEVIRRLPDLLSSTFSLGYKLKVGAYLAPTEYLVKLNPS